MTQEEFFTRYTYNIRTDKIGGGGFGNVYKAKDTLLHRTVAVKVSEVKTTADGQKTFSLKDEFEALAHVPKHPNIANYEELYSFDSPQGMFDYAVMQFYPDGNLGNAIREGLTDRQKENVALQLLEGIDFLHRHKVVHRDLKPGNILIVRDGDKVIPLITDFGLSKSAGSGDGSVFSNSFGGGTQRYSSPEQLQGKPLRFNTDLWSFGAILYELFTGDQLFSAGSSASNSAQADLEIYNKIVGGDVGGLNKMPETWRRVAERCLVTDPEKRAKTAGELLSLVKGDDEKTVVDAGPETKTEPEPKTKADVTAKGSATDKRKVRRAALWTGVGLVVAALVLAAVMLLKPKPADPDTLAYEACQTVDDYRAYMRDYGQKAAHFADAKKKVDEFVADSIAKAQRVEEGGQTGTQTDVSDSPATDEQEEAAYRKCTTVAACDSYLKTYPKGKYVEEVKAKKAQIEAQTKPESAAQTGSANGHDWVDLGLPSGTLWATCNVGASKPESYGNYNAWGETSTKNPISWYHYKYASGPNKLTKYCNKGDCGDNGFTDNLTTLQRVDDPAAAWGSGWHTPSKGQWDELLANTTHKWTTRNGVKGRLFTSKKNGQTLFLPAAGYRSGSGTPYAPGVHGYYWSRSLDTGNPNYAWKLHISSEECKVVSFERVNEHPVRPVREK